MSQVTLSRIVKALWYEWNLPELGRHEGTLAQVDNPVVQRAREAIQGGNETLAAAIQEGDPALLLLLDQAHANEPPEGLKKLLKARTEQSLAADIWPDKDPVMVAEFDDPFGNYDELAHHICNTYYKTDGRGSLL